MKNNKLFKTVIKLISLGFIAKLLSTLAKVITIRILKTEAMGIYTLATSSLILIITLSQLGLSTTISRLVAAGEKDRIKIIRTATVIVSITTLILTLLITFGARHFANNVLKNPDTLLSLYCLIPFIPLVAFGMIIKSYFIGINKIEITGIAQVSEEVLRIVFLIGTCTYFNQFGPKYGAAAAIVSLSIGEIASVFHMLIYSKKVLAEKLPKMFKGLNNKNEYLIKDMVPISLSMTTGRLVSSLIFFVEPIILTNIMLNQGFTNKEISIQYALLTSYAMPLLLLPGFFSNAFSNILLPIISKDVAKKNFIHAQKAMKTLTFYSTIVGLSFATICFFFPEFLMNLLYGNIEGAKYVRIISFPFILYYIQAPLSATLVGLNQEQSALRDTMIGAIFRVLLLVITIPYLQIYGIVIATICNAAIVTILHLITIKKHLFSKQHINHQPHKHIKKSV